MKSTTKTPIPPAFKLTSKARVIPKDQRLVMPPGAYEPRNIKVRTNIHLDLDILNYFQERAALPGATRYQTQINAELRKIMERDLARDKTAPIEDKLDQAKQLISEAVGALRDRRR